MYIENRLKGMERKMEILESMVCDIYDAVITNKKECPVCKSKIRLYTPFNNRRNACCPVCRALERHRALYLYFERYTRLLNEETDIKVLHFAPERCFFNIFKSMKNVDYYPVDIMQNRYEGLRKNVDITDITYEDKTFDYIICNHVLEHVEDDKRAMRELNRVLKNNGEAYLNVPLNMQKEKTFEDPAYNTPDLRLKYYGQSDHVRIYGKDYVERLKDTGWRVEIIEIYKTFSNEDILKYHLLNEYMFRCMKK